MADIRHKLAIEEKEKIQAKLKLYSELNKKRK